MYSYHASNSFNINNRVGAVKDRLNRYIDGYLHRFRAVITFTTSTGAPLAAAGLTDAAGQYATSTFATLGTYRVQAHFLSIFFPNIPGQAKFGPSNSAIETVTVP
jgi:hypothetical protein